MPTMTISHGISSPVLSFTPDGIECGGVREWGDNDDILLTQHLQERI